MGFKIIGIDPGPSYTAVSVTDDHTIILSTTYKRPDDMSPAMWALTVTQLIHKEIVSEYPNAIIGIENVTPPQTHFQGKLSLLPPKHLISLALIVGALINQYPTCVLVRAGKNGSGAYYPKELLGRRPKDLPGKAVGTRQHEKSAYDVNRQTLRLHREGYILDTQKNIFHDK